MTKITELEYNFFSKSAIYAFIIYTYTRDFRLKTMEQWDGEISSLKDLLPEVRLEAAKKLTLLQMCNKDFSALNETILDNVKTVLYRLKISEHQEYINHIIELLEKNNRNISRFNDFLTLLDMLPSSSYEQWMAEEKNQWIQAFFISENLVTIDFFKTLTQKPIAVLRFISQYGLKSIIPYISNPEELLYRIANLSWDDLPDERSLAHVQPHHYLIQLKKFINFKMDFAFSELDDESLKELEKDWKDFIPAFTQRTQKICAAHNINPLLPVSFIADSSELSAMYRDAAKSHTQEIALEDPNKNRLQGRERRESSISVTENRLFRESRKNQEASEALVYSDIVPFDYSKVSTDGLENILFDVGNFDQQLAFIKKLPQKLLDAQVPQDNPERLQIIIDYFKPLYISMPEPKKGMLETQVLKCLKTQWMQPKLHAMMLKTALQSLDLKNDYSFIYYQSTVLTLIDAIKQEEGNPTLCAFLNNIIYNESYFVQRQTTLIDYLFEKAKHADRSKMIQYLPEILEIILALKEFSRSAQANNHLPTISMWEKLSASITVALEKFGRRGKLFSKNISLQIKIYTDKLKSPSVHPVSNDSTQEAKEISDGTPDFVDFQMAIEHSHFGDLSTLNNAIKMMLVHFPSENRSSMAFRLSLSMPEQYAEDMLGTQALTTIYQHITMQENLGNALVSAALRTDSSNLEALADLLSYITQLTQLCPTIKEKIILQNGFAKALALAANHAFLKEYHYLSKERIPYFIFTALLNWIKIHETSNRILFKAVSLFVHYLTFEAWDKIIDLWPDKKTIIALFWRALDDNANNQKTFLKKYMIKYLEKKDLSMIDATRINIYQQLECLGEITPMNNPEQFKLIIQHFKKLKQNDPETLHSDFIIALLETLKKQWALTIIDNDSIETAAVALSSLDMSQEAQKKYRNDVLKHYCELILANCHDTQNEQPLQLSIFMTFCLKSLTMSFQEIFSQIIPTDQQLFVAQELFLSLDSKQTEPTTDAIHTDTGLDIEIPPIKIILNALSDNPAAQAAFLDYCVQEKGVDIVVPFVALSQQLAFIHKFSATKIDKEDSCISISSGLKSETINSSIDRKEEAPKDIISMLKDISGAMSQLDFIRDNPHLIDSPEKLTQIIDDFQKFSSGHSLFEITLLDILKTQWLEPLNETMFQAAMACLDWRQPKHLAYYENIYSLLLTSCSKPENVINITDPILISSKWTLITRETTFKSYLNEKKEREKTPLPELMDMLFVTQLFNQRHPNNTVTQGEELKSAIKKGLNIETGGRRTHIMAWFEKKIDAHILKNTDQEKQADIDAMTSEEPPLGIRPPETSVHSSIKSVVTQFFLSPPPIAARESSAGHTTNGSDSRSSSMAVAFSPIADRKDSTGETANQPIGPLVLKGGC